VTSLGDALDEFTAISWSMIRRGLRLNVTNVEYKMEPHLSHLDGSSWATQLFLREVRLFAHVMMPEFWNLEELKKLARRLKRAR
jgi:hypothetical protein